jgi:hypothetical protein
MFCFLSYVQCTVLCDAVLTGSSLPHWIANYTHTETWRFTASQMMLHLSTVKRTWRYFMFFRRSGGLWAPRRPATSRRTCTVTDALAVTQLYCLQTATFQHSDWWPVEGVSGLITEERNWIAWCLVNLTASGHVTSHAARVTLCDLTLTGTTVPADLYIPW